MRRSAENSTKVAYSDARVTGIDPELCIREWRRLHPFKTAQYVAALYDMPVRTVENWLAGTAKPSGDKLGVIFSRSSPRFLVAVMPQPPEWLVEAARRERVGELERDIARLDRELDEART